MIQSKCGVLRREAALRRVRVQWTAVAVAVRPDELGDSKIYPLYFSLVILMVIISQGSYLCPEHQSPSDKDRGWLALFVLCRLV